MNDGLKTTERIYAWIAQDLQGIEGVISVEADGAILPLLVTDREMALSFRDFAKEAATARKSVARLVIFDRGEEIDYQLPD